MSYSINDFDQEVFKDPIALINALKERNEAFAGTEINEVDFICEKAPIPADLLSISAIAERYNLPAEIIKSAIKAKELIPTVYVPFFCTSDVDSFVRKSDFSLSPLVVSFLKEIDCMYVNYSYKPLLLLGIMECANELGEVSLSDIVDYYFDFYNSRRLSGLIAEKDDSAFIKHPNDRNVAKRTIIRYPLTIYVNRQFLSYIEYADVIRVEPEIWQYILTTGKKHIQESCNAILNQYYQSIV